MRRDIAKPLNARGFKADIGVKPASHGVVDDGLPLLLQQPGKLLFGTDGTTNASINVVQIAYNSGLLSEGWERK